MESNSNQQTTLQKVRNTDKSQLVWSNKVMRFIQKVITTQFVG